MKNIRQSHSKLLTSSRCSSAILPTKKLESIKEYIDLLSQKPQEAETVELRWEITFYRKQLKNSMEICNSFVKLLGDKEKEIQQLLKELCQIKEQKSDLQENKAKEPPNQQTPPQNSTNSSNKKGKRKLSENLNSIQKSQRILQNSREENSYLRDQLLLLGQKLSKKQQENRLLKRQNYKLKQKINKRNEKVTAKDCKGFVLDFSTSNKFSPINAIKKDIPQIQIESSDEKEKGTHFEKEFPSARTEKEQTYREEPKVVNSRSQNTCAGCTALEEELKIDRNQINILRMKLFRMVDLELRHRQQWQFALDEIIKEE